MDWAKDFVPYQVMEIPKYFVYYGIFITQKWYKRFVQAAKGEFLEVPQIIRGNHTQAKALQSHHGGHPSTSAGYIAATASIHGVPSFFRRIIKIILPPFSGNVNLDGGKLWK